MDRFLNTAGLCNPNSCLLSLGVLAWSLTATAACGEVPDPTETAQPHIEGLVGYTAYVDAGSTSGGAAAYSSAYARFAASGDPDGCVTTVQDNGCWHTVCPPISAHPALLDAGLITITNGRTHPITLESGTDHDYGRQGSGQTWWMGGDSVHVRVEGAPGGAAGFEVDLVAPPEELSLDDLLERPTWRADGGITVSWETSSVIPGTFIRASFGKLHEDGVWCVVAAERGNVTIPGPVIELVSDRDTWVDLTAFTWTRVAGTKILLSGALSGYHLANP